MDLFDVFVVVEAYKKTAAGLVSKSKRSLVEFQGKTYVRYTNPNYGKLSFAEDDLLLLPFFSWWCSSTYTIVILLP